MELGQLVSTARRESAENDLHGWTFGLSKSRRRLGVCKYRAMRIENAEFYARHRPEELVLDPLRHEIAHAIAGPAAEHGPRWKAMAIRLGATTFPATRRLTWSSSPATGRRPAPAASGPSTSIGGPGARATIAAGARPARR